ncbi:MAG: hypothetical protein PHI19_01385 [Clostridia bacterium]|nr:hypothetical protein [Clostridia bacterium]
MAENPQRLNKSMMNSPYFSGYTQGKQGAQPVNRPNMYNVRQGGVPVRSGQPSQQTHIYGRPIYSDRGSAKSYAKYQKFNNKEYDAYSKQKRRERDYFFVMRKGTCFFMLVLAAILIAVIALGFVGIPSLNNYTSLFVQPDNTVAEDRGEGYEDTTKHISFADPIYGFISKIMGKEMLDANGNPYTYQENADAIAAEANETPEDSMGAIASIIYQYFPIAIAVIAIFALVILIIGFGGMLGKRIFKGYGALAIVMLVMSLVVTVAGLAVLGNKAGNPQIGEDGTLVSVLDFSKVLPFLTRIFTGVPNAAVDGEAAVTPAAYAAGYGLMALIVIPLLIMVLSLFARRKVPYSVFDR